MKKKGNSTCFACSFKVKDDVDHVQKFQHHLKLFKHPKEKAWYCQNKNCKKRNFKPGGLRTCSENRPYFRVEEQDDHISENEHIKKNEIEINAKRIMSLTCGLCKKTFTHASDKSKHQLGEKCKL